MYKYGAAVIFFHPDKSAIRRAWGYCEVFEHVLIADNTGIRVKRDACIEYGIKKLIQNPKVHYYSPDKNQGMSAALNYAYKWAYEKGLDYLLTMDQDTDYNITYIRKMKRYIDSQEKGVVAVYASNYRKIYKGRYGETYGRWKYRETEVADSMRAMTSGSFYDVSVMQRFLPLPDLFIGMVDDDISYAVSDSGYRIRTAGFSKISQRVGLPVKDTVYNRFFHKVILKPERYYFMGRNSRYLLKKYSHNPKICRCIKKCQARIVLGILLTEENKFQKYTMWRKGCSDTGLIERLQET